MPERAVMPATAGGMVVRSGTSVFNGAHEVEHWRTPVPILHLSCVVCSLQAVSASARPV